MRTDSCRRFATKARWGTLLSPWQGEGFRLSGSDGTPEVRFRPPRFHPSTGSAHVVELFANQCPCLRRMDHRVTSQGSRAPSRRCRPRQSTCRCATLTAPTPRNAIWAGTPLGQPNGQRSVRLTPPFGARTIPVESHHCSSHRVDACSLPDPVWPTANGPLDVGEDHEVAGQGRL